MEHFDYTFRRGLKPGFDQIPHEHRRAAFGVDYAHLRGLQSGDLYVTRQGWGAVASLLPVHWFTGNLYCKPGRALAGATGAVYKVPVPHPARRDFHLVVKFSRAAQDVGLTVIETGMRFDTQEREQIEAAEFLSPFEEFAALARLRAEARGQVRTMQALAIYCPPTRHLEWQLGRKPWICQRMSADLAKDQASKPECARLSYDWERLYILLYAWVSGVDAEQALALGLIGNAEMVALGIRARGAMRRAGWMACDHKPRHVIIRYSRSGGVLRQHDEPAYAIVDYELLVPVGPEVPGP